MRSGSCRGFVYIGLLIGLTVIGIGLGAVSEVWYQTSQREREEELLFIGDQFRQAITRYYLESPRSSVRFPMRMEELLQDDRSPDKARRYLRKLYPDPMTGKTDWGEIHLPSGQLVGVYSQSGDAPLKVAGFAARDKDMLDKLHYSEWIFRSPLPAANPLLAPASSYTGPGSAGPGGRPPTPGVSTPPGFVQPRPRTR
jgi:type II secretory pathway pseudopilin PulG